MTDATPTTSTCRDEGLTTLSPIEATFVRLARTLDQCIAAERCLLEVDAMEFDEAQTACEAAGETLTTQLGKLLAMADAGPADRSLRRLAFLLKCALSIEHDADRAHLAASLLDQAPLFELRASHPADPLIRGLGRRCLAQVAQLVELRDTTVIPKSTSAVRTPGLAA
jgi:hypothetical protein